MSSLIELSYSCFILDFPYAWLTLLSLLEPLCARRMPRKVVSGPDYDDEYDDYDEYDDDYDDYDDTTKYGNNRDSAKTGKGMLSNLLLLSISPLMRRKCLLELLHSLIPTTRIVHGLCKPFTTAVLLLKAMVIKVIIIYSLVLN